jgi:hypothetical protein
VRRDELATLGGKEAVQARSADLRKELSVRDLALIALALYASGRSN